MGGGSPPPPLAALPLSLAEASGFPPLTLILGGGFAASLAESLWLSDAPPFMEATPRPWKVRWTI